MKKQVLVTMTLVGMTLAACSKKDSYRSGKMGANNGGGGLDVETSLSVEQKALEILDKDTAFKAVYDNEQSENLKNSIQGIEIKQMVQQVATTDIAVMQFAILDKSSQECSPIHFNTQGYTQEALLKGVKIKGQYRLQCIDTDCNDLLFFKEQSHTDAHSPVAIPVGTMMGSAVVRLSKDENGVYKPVQSENDVFVKAQGVDEAIEKCLTDKAATSAHATNADTRKASEAMTDADTRRLYEIDQKIAELQSKLYGADRANRSQAPQELKASIDSLKAERLEVVKRIEKKRQDAVRARDAKARQEYATLRNEARLMQIDREIKAVDEEMNSLGTLQFIKRNKLNKKRADLVAARDIVAKSVKKSEVSSETQMVNPVDDMKGPR